MRKLGGLELGPCPARTPVARLYMKLFDRWLRVGEDERERVTPQLNTAKQLFYCQQGLPATLGAGVRDDAAGLLRLIADMDKSERGWREGRHAKAA